MVLQCCGAIVARDVATLLQLAMLRRCGIAATCNACNVAALWHCNATLHVVRAVVLQFALRERDNDGMRCLVVMQ